MIRKRTPDLRLIDAKFGRSVLAVMVAGLLSAPVNALSPDIEADRLMLAVQNHLKADDHGRAQDALARLEALKVEPPLEFFFYKGQVAWHFQNAEEAKSALEKYVQRAGRDGEHYQTALAMLTEIEESSTRTATAGQEAKADIAWQQAQGVHSDEYVEKLRKLYLKERPQEALVEHINSLLASAPYQPSRIITPDQKEGVRYSLSLGGNGVIVVQETKFDDSGNAHVALDRRDIFGIDPYVRFGCDDKRRACWIYDPLNEHREWLVLADKREVAEDLSKAVTKLILTLQNPA